MEEERKYWSAKKVYSVTGFIMLMSLIIGQVSVVLVGLAIKYWNLLSEQDFQKYGVWILTIVSLYLIMFPLYLLMMSFVPTKPAWMHSIDNNEKIHYDFGKIAMLFVICLSLTYLTNIPSVWLNQLIGFFKGEEIANPLEDIVNNSSLIIVFVIACVIGPIIEEITYRKVLLSKLAGYGEKAAVILSALFFGTVHGNLYQVFYAFVLGLVFAHITVKSGTIKYACILHILINTMGTVVIPQIASSENNSIVAMVSLFIIVLIIAGIVLLVKNKATLFPKLDTRLPIDGSEPAKASTGILTPGVILYLIVIVGIMIAGVVVE